MRVFFVLVVAALSLTALPVYAQPGDRDAADSKAESSERVGRVIERIQQVRLRKLTEFLDDVPADKIANVDKALRAYDRDVVLEHQTMKRKIRRLKRAVRRGESDETINRLIDKVVAHRKQIDELRYNQYKAASKHLSGASRARLMFFLPEFEKNIRKAMRRARRGDRKGRENRRRDP